MMVEPISIESVCHVGTLNEMREIEIRDGAFSDMESNRMDWIGLDWLSRHSWDTHSLSHTYTYVPSQCAYHVAVLVTIITITLYPLQVQTAVDTGIPTQLSYGFICGYCSGLALKKAGRAAAVVFGTYSERSNPYRCITPRQPSST